MENIITFEQFNEALNLVCNYRKQVLAQLNEIDFKIMQNGGKKELDLDIYLKDLNINTRLHNIILDYFGFNYHERRNQKIEIIQNISLQRLRSSRNLGSKTYQQFIDLCVKLGISPLD